MKTTTATTGTEEQFKLVRIAGITGTWPYLVSDRGRVISAKTGKVLEPQPVNRHSRRGWGVTFPYYQLVLYRRKSKHEPQHITIQVSRLVMENFVGKRPADKTINHKDGNKANNALVNLEYISLRENIDHYHKKKRVS